MTHTNILNRKLEEVHGVGKEFGSVAALWSRFQGMVHEKQVDIQNWVVLTRRMSSRPTRVYPGPGGRTLRQLRRGRESRSPSRRQRR